MKRLIFIGLIILGFVEVFFGLVAGPEMVEVMLPDLTKELDYTHWTAAQNTAFWRYHHMLKEDWRCVAWFGAATILLALILYCVCREDSPPGGEQFGVNYRRYIVIVIGTVGFAGFFASFGLFFHLQGISPTIPIVAAGQVFQLNNHGYLFYVIVIRLRGKMLAEST